MGMSHSLYIGPYAHCVNPRVNSTRKEKACGNEKCSRFQKYAGASFCDACGGKIQSIDVPVVTNKIDDGEVREAIKEHLHQNTDYTADERAPFDNWISNATDLFHERETEYFTGEQEIADDVPAEEKKRFAKIFAKEIEVLRKFYGDAAVTIRWGMLGRYS